MIGRTESWRLVLSLTAVLGLSACLDPRDYETAPVEVATAEGIVTCQLYTQERVIWDRAIGFPRTISVKAADKVCQDEGLRRGGKG